MATVSQTTVTPAIPQDVWAMTQALVEAFDPERIYLFGSYARGDAGPDSDYDLMMIVGSSDQPQYKRSQQARGAVSAFTHAKDILVWTCDEFDKRIHLKASLPATILREGVLLYAR
jgi:predicted nucleotidyltransferase